MNSMGNYQKNQYIHYQSIYTLRDSQMEKRERRNRKVI